MSLGEADMYADDLYSKRIEPICDRLMVYVAPR